ncbi:MAG: metallophosphoesterase, partial [Gammaproteobacteria bacterium]
MEGIMYQQKLPAGPASGPGWRVLLAALGLGIAWLLQGCGGGGGGVADVGADPGSGEVLVTLTDAEGDFVTYTVDITSLRLEHANGTLVETLPQTTRLDFAQYVDLTELLTAAQVPNGRYVGGSITLDYSNADIQVEVGGVAVPATVVDQAGQPLSSYTLELRLDEGRPLVVAPGLPALLNIDFDLAASHEVDTSAPVPTATASPFLLADIEPVDEKELRARGPLRAVNIDDMYYAIRLRPWHHRVGDYGRAKIHVRDDTEFEVNGETWLGADGLRALEAAGVGTPTVALGILDVSERKFTASRVLAGDSVPGERFDAVFGNVTARNGNVLTVRGATVVPRAGSVIFNDDVEITVSDDTVVRKPGEPGVNQGIGAVSVGQRVVVLGEVTSNPALPGLTMDATQGRIRMRYTQLFGLANSVVPGQINIDLRSIDRRRIALFDFSGTGMTPDVDADPTDYEVTTATLDTSFVVPQTPVQVAGFVRPFGEAPPDFEGRTV